MGVNFAKEIEMNNLLNCPKCNSEYVYEDGAPWSVQSVLMNGTQLKS